jgi:hypothetical protein
MKFTKKEASMKKMTMTVMTLLLLVLMAGAEPHGERQYANLGFTVWQLDNGAKEAIDRINTPIPEVFRESWIYEFVSMDITEGKAVTKVVEKDGLRFVLIAEPNKKLTIHVIEKEKDLLRIVLCRPSTIDTIFYGSESRTYLIEVTYTVGSHPIGLLSPGIRK